MQATFTASTTLATQVLQVLRGKLKVVRVARTNQALPAYENGTKVLLMFGQQQWHPATVIEQPNVLGHYGVRFEINPRHTIVWFAHTSQLRPIA